MKNFLVLLFLVCGIAINAQQANLTFANDTVKGVQTKTVATGSIVKYNGIVRFNFTTDKTSGSTDRSSSVTICMSDLIEQARSVKIRALSPAKINSICPDALFQTHQARSNKTALCARLRLNNRALR